MTQQETRQLGIEFERRLLVMFPDEAINKLDTDTIYSFQNEYQTLYIKQLFLLADQTESNTNVNSKLLEVLGALTKHEIIDKDKTVTDHFIGSNKDPYLDYEKGWIDKIGDINFLLVSLPKDYYFYIRSSSLVSRTYKDSKYDTENLQYLPNKLIKQSDVDKILMKPYNKGAVLRHPLVVLEDHTDGLMKVIVDTYTDVSNVDLTYCKIPNQFNVKEGSSNCELPYSCFDELVSGAVNLYLQYKTGVKPEPKQQKQLEADK